MADEKKAFRNLEEAFASLDPVEQAHCKRVSRYAEIIFAGAEARDIYLNTPKGEKEIVAENVPLLAAAGMYHSISMARGGNTDPGQPASRSAALFEELAADDKQFKAAGRKLIRNAIQEQEERLDGSGFPMKKSGDSISYGARVLALANALDEMVMSLVSEHPMEDALKALKKKVPDWYDPEFYKVMRSCKAKLNRVFEADREASHAVPAAEPIVRRRATRPMELVYRPVCREDGEVYAREASMRFRNVKDNTLTYEEVKHIITKQGMGMDICEYFLYELCDTVRRFDACGIPCSWIALEMLPVFYNRKKLAAVIKGILETEGVPAGRVRPVIPGELMRKPTKALLENLKECGNQGISFLLTGVDSELLKVLENGCGEYPFGVIRVVQECLMDYTVRERSEFLCWKERGTEILSDEMESGSQVESVLENGATGYTGPYAGIYEQEEDIVRRALELSGL